MPASVAYWRLLAGLVASRLPIDIGRPRIRIKVAAAAEGVVITGEVLQAVLEALRQNAEVVLAVGVGAGVLLLVLAAYYLGLRRSSRRAAHLHEQARALEKSLAQAQADGSAALRQLAQYEAQLASRTQELSALRTSQAETLARLEQTRRDNEQLRQEHAEWADRQRALAESKGRLEGQIHTLDGELQRLRSELDSKVAERVRQNLL